MIELIISKCDTPSIEVPGRVRNLSFLHRWSERKIFLSCDLLCCWVRTGYLPGAVTWLSNGSISTDVGPLNRPIDTANFYNVSPTYSKRKTSLILAGCCLCSCQPEYWKGFRYCPRRSLITTWLIVDTPHPYLRGPFISLADCPLRRCPSTLLSPQNLGLSPFYPRITFSF